MKKENILEINFLDINENQSYVLTINNVLKEAFKEERILDKNVYINLILTNPQNIKEINKKYRNIDKETDVLSFPMFEKHEIEELKNSKNAFIDVLGDIIISIERVEQQAKEYNHSFERELSYMVIHGFYHLMGYDHMTEEEKGEMREKEEKILNKLNINR